VEPAALGRVLPGKAATEQKRQEHVNGPAFVRVLCVSVVKPSE